MGRVLAIAVAAWAAVVVLAGAANPAYADDPYCAVHHTNHVH
jgi:hypothetical protein